MIFEKAIGKQLALLKLNQRSKTKKFNFLCSLWNEVSRGTARHRQAIATRSSRRGRLYLRFAKRDRSAAARAVQGRRRIERVAGPLLGRTTGSRGHDESLERGTQQAMSFWAVVQ